MLRASVSTELCIQTQNVVLSECLLKFRLRKWRALFHVRTNIHAFCAFQIHSGKYPEAFAILRYAALSFYTIFFCSYTLFFACYVADVFFGSSFFMSHVELFLRLNLSLSLESCSFLPWLQFLQNTWLSRYFGLSEKSVASCTIVSIHCVWRCTCSPGLLCLWSSFHCH